MMNQPSSSMKQRLDHSIHEIGGYGVYQFQETPAVDTTEGESTNIDPIYSLCGECDDQQEQHDKVRIS